MQIKEQAQNIGSWFRSFCVCRKYSNTRQLLHRYANVAMTTEIPTHRTTADNRREENFCKSDNHISLVHKLSRRFWQLVFIIDIAKFVSNNKKQRTKSKNCGGSLPKLKTKTERKMAIEIRTTVREKFAECLGKFYRLFGWHKCTAHNPNPERSTKNALKKTMWTLKCKKLGKSVQLRLGHLTFLRHGPTIENIFPFICTFNVNTSKNDCLACLRLHPYNF